MNEPLKNVIIPKIIETERLELRLVTFEMAEDCNAAILASLAEFKPWFEWLHPKPPTLKDSQENLLSNIKEQINKEAFHFHGYLKGTETMVGRISLDKESPDIPSFNIGYWTHSAHAGNGYMTEMCNEICDFAINTLKSRRLEIYHDSENKASETLIKRLVKSHGFEKLGTLKNVLRRKHDSTLSHHVMYAFTQDD